MKIGLFFGSFNPIHIGHLAIANYMVEFTDLDKVWFVISPHNPFKKKQSLLADNHRLRLVQEAIGDNNMYAASDIEFKLPQPSYTIHTLTYLFEKYPAHEFALIMGSDNLAGFKRWRNYEQILKLCTLYVYPRPGSEAISDPEIENRVKHVNAPLIEISSTFIREAIAAKKDVPFFLNERVYTYIKEMNFYLD